MNELTTDELKIICDTVVRLAELRQKECSHLSVDDFAKECMGKLLTSLMAHKEGRMVMPLDDCKSNPLEILINHAKYRFKSSEGLNLDGVHLDGVFRVGDGWCHISKYCTGITPVD